MMMRAWVHRRLGWWIGAALWVGEVRRRPSHLTSVGVSGVGGRASLAKRAPERPRIMIIKAGGPLCSPPACFLTTVLPLGTWSSYCTKSNSNHDRLLPACLPWPVRRYRNPAAWNSLLVLFSSTICRLSSANKQDGARSSILAICFPHPLYRPAQHERLFK